MRWYYWLIIFVLLFAAISWIAVRLWKKEKNSDQLAEARKVHESSAIERAAEKLESKKEGDAVTT